VSASLPSAFFVGHSAKKALPRAALGKVRPSTLGKGLYAECLL
jgi:hypothetical protein